MAKYVWTLGGGWSEAASIEELKEFYQRSGNMSNDFVAFAIDSMGNKVNISKQIADEVLAQQTKTLNALNKKWWEFWK